MWSLCECSSLGRLINQSGQFVVMNIQGGERKQTGLVGCVTEDKHASGVTGMVPRASDCHFTEQTPTGAQVTCYLGDQGQALVGLVC